MEFLTLDVNLQPDRLIENYESLIWSERYFANGDFELQSSDVHTTINALPRGSFVSLRESTVPMIVEDHVIKKNLRGAPLLTVTGRSLETVLERRASVHQLSADYSEDPREAWIIHATKESDAAYKVMRHVLGDSARQKDGVEVLPAVTPAVSTLDAIEEIDLTLPADYTPDPPAWSSTVTYAEDDLVSHIGYFWKALDPSTNETPAAGSLFWRALTYEIPAKDLYSTVMELTQIRSRGLKAVRPTADGSKFGIEIYNGANLTEEVVFDARFDQFDDSAYLLTDRGSRNVAYAYGSVGSQIVLKTTSEEPSGISRRVLVVDGITDVPDNTEEVRRGHALVELYKYNVTALFDGQIAYQVASGYNTTYHLGDILKLTGEYGLSQNVRVVEFIRTSDATGEKSYPTFQAVD